METKFITSLGFCKVNHSAIKKHNLPIFEKAKHGYELNEYTLGGIFRHQTKKKLWLIVHEREDKYFIFVGLLKSGDFIKHIEISTGFDGTKKEHNNDGVNYTNDHQMEKKLLSIAVEDYIK